MRVLISSIAESVFDDRLLAGLGTAQRRLGHRHDLVGVLGDLAVRAGQLLHRRRGLADRRGLLGGAGGLLLGGREDVVADCCEALARTPASAGSGRRSGRASGCTSCASVADLVFGRHLDLVADVALARRLNAEHDL